MCKVDDLLLMIQLYAHTDSTKQNSKIIFISSLNDLCKDCNYIISVTFFNLYYNVLIYVRSLAESLRYFYLVILRISIYNAQMGAHLKLSPNQNTLCLILMIVSLDQKTQNAKCEFYMNFKVYITYKIARKDQGLLSPLRQK